MSETSLRERRRRQTARDIQLSTLRLAARHGLESVTAEMIAAEAGVSLRTFFNYFPNKEAAAAGEPPHFTAREIELFVQGEGSLTEDLRLLMRRNLTRIAEDRELLSALRKARDASPELMLSFVRAMGAMREDLRVALARRAPQTSPTQRALITAMVHETGLLGIQLWAEGDEPAFPPLFDAIWAEVPLAAAILTL